jgi:small subunit ribosomal protein S4e
MTRTKRLLAPKFWKISRKKTKWVVTPAPGPHSKFESLPLQIILRDILKVVETGREAMSVLKKGEVLVDGKLRKDAKYPAGLMDTVAVPKIKKYFRIVATADGLGLVEIPEKESKLKLCKIEDKTILRGGRVQLNLHDGKNIIVPKGAKDSYKTGDTLLLELPSLKIIDHIKIEPGMLGLFTHGKNSGRIGKIKEIIVTRTREPNKIVCEIDKKIVESMKDHVFVVGKSKPVISLGVAADEGE